MYQDAMNFYAEQDDPPPPTQPRCRTCGRLLSWKPTGEAPTTEHAWGPPGPDGEPTVITTAGPVEPFWACPCGEAWGVEDVYRR